MTTPRIKAFADYMGERHRIYQKRMMGRSGPWTEDPILSQGRFCNIFRELDTVTIWVEENIRKPYADHPNLWLMLCIARYINWPPTLAELIQRAEVDNVPCWPSHPDFDMGEKFLARPEVEVGTCAAAWVMEERAKRKEKVYTGAYMIRAESDRRTKWYSWTKHAYIMDIVVGRLWEDRAEWEQLFESNPSQQEVWAKFQAKRYVGWGPFMAYEVVTDLRHTRYLKDAADIYTWANAGPGAIRGLNRLYGRELVKRPKAAQTNEEMKLLMEDLNQYDEVRFNLVFGDPRTRVLFEMRDIEHTLCEFDKYERVRLGEGQMRSSYRWKDATNIAKQGTW